MGKFKKGILGKFSGTIASVVGSVWRGIPYMRSVADSYKNPNTPKQVAQRARFGACTKFVNLVKTGIVLPIWEKKAVKMTGVNLFVKTNQHCFDDDGNILDYPNMKFSIGNLPLPENIVVVNSRTGNGLIVISWTDNSGSSTAIATDRLMLVTLTGNKPTVMSTLDITRAAETATVQLANGAGETVHLYIFFSDPAGENYSTSFYAVVNIPALPNP
jgi:hypothetical protein